MVNLFGWFRVMFSYPLSMNEISVPLALVPETDLNWLLIVVSSLGVNKLNCGINLKNKSIYIQIKLIKR